MKNPKSRIQNPKSPRGFTLTELLVVMLVISILAGMTVAALSAAVNDAKASRTKTVINKIDALISERWEGYRTRAIRVPAGGSAIIFAQNRLSALRELQRLELPDRISDLCTNNELLDLQAEVAPVNPKLDAIESTTNVKRALLSMVPSITRSYKRLAERIIEDPTNPRPWTTDNQGAECLFLILSVMKDGDKSATDYFSTDEIGDVDGDGMREILDGWGQPIQFLRWAPGYSREQPGPDNKWGVATTDDNSNSATDEFDEFLWTNTDDFLWSLTTQSRDSRVAPDPFDPLKIDSRWTNGDVASRPFAIRPLIFSGGLDRVYDIHVGTTIIDQATLTPPNDPYLSMGLTGLLVGTPADSNSDSAISGDNITNHDNTAQ